MGDKISIIDSVRVYGKTKDVFGWPKSTEKQSTSTKSTSMAKDMSSAAQKKGAPSLCTHISTENESGELNVDMFDTFQKLIFIIREVASKQPQHFINFMKHHLATKDCKMLTENEINE